ncbi:GNAT family N-acetyltransferase [Bacillus pseudomycoides]|uniref:GNAT family N-acetyltransferase n=1 Tax=Bacillus pseudomycoides TaxID=64104 RepID=A0A2C3X681_9BACI|nr:GNAT family N-acetyltransferase [Bacillus pseudomycoides]PDY47326.1 GNAT family N-acetyltransferase [Bacillus pseudomycoides]PEA82270.1 GNAT family N-acetyltransferase [Bacillus pseudomycoides]PED06266.1 GNAT family N-acetyltransferase [Bacillus pseudomycoides]PED72124.1 GNAT family N-acetyltransferase [Bacillus pseudomycoides]PEI45586.1 GNAT family N-acetyltransferase [Bacillus pseudomycoides]
MIQKANEEEVQQILNFAAQSLFEGTKETCQLSQEKAIEITQPLLDKGAYYLVVKQENVLAGWILIGENTDYFSGEKMGFIYELYIFPEYREKGLSRKLMKTGIDRLQEVYREIRLNVFAGNFAKEMYKEFGFVERQVVMTLKQEK